jgi:hypothetical protein
VFAPLVLALAQEVPTPSDKGALYASISAVVVSLIGGSVAVITSARSKGDPPPARYIDPPTSHALPAAMAELYEEVVREKADLEHVAALWETRARSLGWTDS